VPLNPPKKEALAAETVPLSEDLSILEALAGRPHICGDRPEMESAGSVEGVPQGPRQSRLRGL